MIDLPPPNTRAHPYRGLSVQEVDVPLTPPAVREHLVGREVYRRTEYLALQRDGAVALVAVRKASTEPLFSPVVEARYLAGPHELAWIESPGTDVGNATALWEAARPHVADGLRAYLVRGRYEHVNFLWEPAPVTIRVTEVVPPEPAKLWDQARRVVAFDEDLPPIELELDAVAFDDLAAARPASEYLLPCRGAGVDLPARVEFLDTRPAERGDWTLIGCERSMQFHRHFYGDEPDQVDLCPVQRLRAAPGTAGRVLTKCCLRERGVEAAGDQATVPWGANLDEVRTALRVLVGLEPPATVAVSEPTLAR